MDGLLRNLAGRDGNFIRKNGDIYISGKNMWKLLDMIALCETIPSLLITPYLINIEKDEIYELHYYETEFEIADVLSSYHKKHNKNNSLPEEVRNHIIPKFIVAKDDKRFFLEAMEAYLKNMEKMTFIADISVHRKLSDSKLCYQLF